MKKLTTMFAATVLSFMCTAATCHNGREIATGGLDVAQTACILFHEEIEEETGLAKVCEIAETLIPEIRKILFARKEAAHRKMAAQKASASPSASASK